MIFTSRTLISFFSFHSHHLSIEAAPGERAAMKRKADDLRADEASSNLSAFAALKAQKRDTIQEEASLVHSAVMHLERSGSELLQANEAELRELRGQQIIDTACALVSVALVLYMLTMLINYSSNSLPGPSSARQALLPSRIRTCRI